MRSIRARTGSPHCPTLKIVHPHPRRKQAEFILGASAIAGAIGFVAYVAVRKAMDACKNHQEWKKEDIKLDQAVEDSMAASDATAKY